MTDTDELKTHLIAAIDAAASLDALEVVRVEAMGKQGRVTLLLKTLGAMSPDERQEKGPPIHALREGVTAALAARKAQLEQVALDAQLNSAVELTLNGVAVARGELVAVGEKFGVRLTEIVQWPD